jgi:hypothetical protein
MSLMLKKNIANVINIIPNTDLFIFTNTFYLFDKISINS